MYKKYQRHNVLKRGQVLLVIIMLLATALTIALAVSFKSTTDTQLSKLEEESQRALAAAEAGIEAAIREGNIDLATLNLGSDITGNATVDTVTSKKEFVTPLLQKDEQYTFYLTDYDKDTGAFTGSYNGGTITIYFGQGNCPALELTVVNAAGTSLTRYMVKPGCANFIQGNSSLTVSATGANDLVDGVDLDYKADIDNATLANGNLLFVRVLASSSLSTPIGFKVTGANSLRVQGSTITSEATTATGVTKRVRLFQSYPQIPAEFFVTQF